MYTNTGLWPLTPAQAIALTSDAPEADLSIDLAPGTRTPDLVCGLNWPEAARSEACWSQAQARLNSSLPASEELTSVVLLP